MNIKEKLDLKRDLEFIFKKIRNIKIQISKGINQTSNLDNITDCLLKIDKRYELESKMLKNLTIGDFLK